jgi:hypothetical protein
VRQRAHPDLRLVDVFHLMEGGFRALPALPHAQQARRQRDVAAITSCVDQTTRCVEVDPTGTPVSTATESPGEVLVTTIEKSVGVRVPANEHEGTAGHTAEDTPHSGVVQSNRPAERTTAMTPTGMTGAEPNAVGHHDAGSGGPREHVPGERRHAHADDGQHMA